MRNFIAFAALAALTTFASAAIEDQPIKVLPASYSENKTHFVDSATSNVYRRHACGVSDDQATEHFKRTVESLHSKHKSSAVGARAPAALVRRQLQQPITVNAYFHVITTAAKAGTFTQQMATDQAAAMNKAYNPIGITFNLVNTSFTANDAWAVADGAAMDELKAALRAGTYQDLNLYLHSDLIGGILGTCTLPSKVPAGAAPSVYVSDGCNVAAGTMPGGNIGGYSQGGTSIHETGHWLGLLHTFEGYTCDGDGDFIDDTPAQSESTDGCPTKPAKDSCPDKTGVDAIHNYMDYSTDACYNNFTPGQVGRIETMWNSMRKGM
jgi:hypothetical protein